MLKSTLILALFSTSVGFAHAGDIAKGKELVEKNNCAACHGAGLKAPVAPAYPKIAGQYQDYLYFSLKSYTVNNANVGRNNAGETTQLCNRKLSPIVIKTYVIWQHTLPPYQAT